MPRKPDTWMPLYIGDYLKDTRSLKTDEHGSYLLLIMSYWCNGPLPDDDEKLRVICGISRTLWKRRIGPTVRAFFRVSDGLLHHSRIDRERAHTLEISAVKRSAANARYSRKANTLRGNANGSGGAGRDAYASRQVDLNGLVLPIPMPERRDAYAPLDRNANATETGMHMHTQSHSQKKESLSQTQYSVCTREASEVQPSGEPYPGSVPPGPIPEPAPRPPPSPPPTAEAAPAPEPEQARPAASKPWRRAPGTPSMPPRSAPPRHWIILSGDDAILDDSPERGGVVAGVFLHLAVEALCQAARIDDPHWRTDWRPLCEWLRAGFTLDDHILPAIRWKASRADYELPRSLMAFDGIIRNWRSDRHHG